MSADGELTIDLHIDTSGIEWGMAKLSNHAVTAGMWYPAAAREFAMAMERVQQLTRSIGGDHERLTQQIYELSLTSGWTLAEATDAVLINGPWHWGWSAAGSEWPWAAADRRSRMHTAYRAKTRRRNRRR